MYRDVVRQRVCSTILVLKASVEILASIDLLGESRNTSNAIQGMLNTIRTIPARMQGMEQTDNSSVEQVMTQLTSQLKAPLEQAMNNTLVPKLEQLVSVSLQNVEMGNKVRKTIGNLDGDILRSV